MPGTNHSVLALDIGEKRIGIAVASYAAGLARPLLTLHNNEHFLEQLKKIVSEENCNLIVIGYPRGMQGQNTKQTAYIETFARLMNDQLGIPITYQDEALTSNLAEKELGARKKNFKREDVDSLAATYILEDYMNGHRYLQETRGNEKV